ncbi:MAG: hypothetical protein IPM81_12825 [Saprospirales bacterium]|nr:hypothetical protein [Saprospirales bacterium]
MQTFETIRARLLSQAAGRFHCNTETLQPDIRLIIDWMARELSGLYCELSKSNDLIQKRVEQRLQPDSATRPRPEHRLAYTRPVRSGTLLDPEEDILSIVRMDKESRHPVFFTPLAPVPLVKGSVRFLASDRALRMQVVAHDFQNCLAAHPETAMHPGVLWAGIQLEAPLPAGQPLCLHISPSKGTERLPLLACQYLGRQMPVTTGFYYNAEAMESHRSGQVDEEYLFLRRLEKEILEHYNSSFIQISLPEGAAAAPLPEELNALFDSEALAAVVEQDLLWLKFVFPSGYPAEDIVQTEIQMNCFPVLNRRIDNSCDRLPAANGGLEVIPLSNAGNGRDALPDMNLHFLSIQRIFTRNTDYKPVVFEQFRQAGSGCYTLQHGRVEANDLRDMYARISELSDLLRCYASTLSLLPQHTVGQALDSIESGASTLHTAIDEIPSAQTDLGYYLHLKILDPREPCASASGVTLRRIRPRYRPHSRPSERQPGQCAGGRCSVGGVNRHRLKSAERVISTSTLSKHKHQNMISKYFFSELAHYWTFLQIA